MKKTVCWGWMYFVVTTHMNIKKEVYYIKVGEERSAMKSLLPSFPLLIIQVSVQYADVIYF